jgi:flagellar biosynthesis GTPase FlhF
LAVPACEAAVRQYPNNTRLAFQLGRAFSKANNFTAAVLQYRRTADRGYAIAQNNLGAMYENGQGVAKDYAQAVVWYRQAAEQGIELAQANLRRLSAQEAAGSPVSADQKKTFATYVIAHGGCGVLEGALMTMSPIRFQVTNGKLDVDLYGRPVIKWSDDDIATALSVFRDCEVKWRSGFGPRVSDQQSAVNLQTSEFKERRFEQELREIILTARSFDTQRKAQQQAKVELEKAQAENKRAQAAEEAQRKEQEVREHAQRDKEAADEARRLAEREEPKIAEATKEAEEARGARQEAEQRLAKIKTIQEQTQTEALAQKQEREPAQNPPSWPGLFFWQNLTTSTPQDRLPKPPHRLMRRNGSSAMLLRTRGVETFISLVLKRLWGHYVQWSKETSILSCLVN